LKEPERALTIITQRCKDAKDGKKVTGKLGTGRFFQAIARRNLPDPNFPVTYVVVVSIPLQSGLPDQCKSARISVPFFSSFLCVFA
jgi:hypothetical protein